MHSTFHQSGKSPGHENSQNFRYPEPAINPFRTRSLKNRRRNSVREIFRRYLQYHKPSRSSKRPVAADAILDWVVFVFPTFDDFSVFLEFLVQDGKKMGCDWMVQEYHYLFLVSIWAACFRWVYQESRQFCATSEVAVALPVTGNNYWSIDLQLGNERLHSKKQKKSKGLWKWRVIDSNLMWISFAL